ncbi:MAG TPA: protein kinase, partial [Sandaracinaceae bacterium]
VLHRAFADGYVLKLVDFGICKPLVPDGLSPTQQGTVIGTPEYMSPEQVQGIDVDVRTDVYSTGVVLYELLTGRTPFAGHDLDRLGRAILFASPPRPSSLRPEVSAVLEAIVLRAMARERTDRHPSMIALQRDLERFAEEHALRRHPSVWALLPAAGTVRPPPPPSDARPARDTQATVEVPRLPVRRGAVAGAVVGALAVLLTAASIVAYYVYDPFASARRDRATVVPWVPEPEPAPTLAPAALELGPLAPDAPHGTSPSPASRDASSGGAPSATPRTDAPSRSEAAEQREPVRAAATVDETARQSLEARRERAREHRRAARRRARRAAARRATTPPATTVAFAPSAPVGATAVAPPLAEQPVASVTAADLYAQVGAQPRPSSAPAVPRSPYDDAARAIPESPYGTDGDGEAADPF